jgi:hypothetical protein
MKNKIVYLIFQGIPHESREPVNLFKKEEDADEWIAGQLREQSLGDTVYYEKEAWILR